MLKKLINKIKYFVAVTVFNRSVEVDSKPFRRELSKLFESTDWGREYSISDITVFKDRVGYTVNITTHYPGILIGKGGTYINFLIKELKERIGHPVNIMPIENKIWSNLYK